jgi:Ala-tRNA(Pro) deacylase
MAIVPSDKSVDINALNQRTNRLLMTASQTEVARQFYDCANGAVPGVAQAYDLRVIWDDSIAQQPDCYLEAGDHEQFIYLAHKDFQALMQDRDHGTICH